MSRTYNTRPIWVQNNNPRNVPVRISHEHSVTLRESVGTEEYEPYWARGETHTRTLYRYWSVPVDCTIDVPETPPSNWRYKGFRIKTNDDKLAEKHCYTYPRFYPENWNSHKSMKRLTNKALRTKINQQLHNAVRDNGSWLEFEAHNDFMNAAYASIGVDAGFGLETEWELQGLDWDGVDIHNDSKYASYGWWD